MSEVTGKQAQFVRWVMGGTGYARSCYQVFLALAERANEKGFCWPSVATLAADGHCSERSVQYAIRQLVADGWLLVHQQRGEKRANVYRINLGRLEKSFQAAEVERRRRYAAELPEIPFAAPKQAESPAYSCGKPEDNGSKAVENTRNSVDKPVFLSGKAEDGQVVRVQTTTPKGASLAGKGCKSFAPKPPVTPTNPNRKAKTKAYCYDGEGHVLKIPTTRPP